MAKEPQHQRFGWRAGAVAAPSLGDYIALASARGDSVTLNLSLGVIEIGSVTVHAGEVTHAELPGSEGDEALDLLGRVSWVRVEVARPSADRRATVTSEWRRHISLVPPEGQARDLKRARADLEAINTATTSAPALEPQPQRAREERARPPSGARARVRVTAAVPVPAPVARAFSSSPSEEHASAPDFDTLFVQAMRAYAQRNYKDALALFIRCAALRPDDSKVSHNIARLQARSGAS